MRGGTAASKAKNSTYSYDAVYDPGSSQQAVFADVEPVVTSVLDGYNVCIFAYGQTGTGNSENDLSHEKKDVPPFLASKGPMHLQLLVCTPTLIAHQTCTVAEES